MPSQHASRHTNNTSQVQRIFWRRIGAIFYDTLLMIAIWFVVTAVALFATGGEAIQNPLYKLLLLLIAFIFCDWCWRRGGQTLGMQAWRIRVVPDKGNVLSHRQTFLRFAVGVATLGLSLLGVWLRQDGKAFHDIVSESSLTRA
ncbi:MAG: hypothetical protein CSB44_05400 [Gammaproteobacteria bacterium]|nr:MAG: hypothetical protein CSB44_05400 [Gammaproteobacteria bacterium]